ncbi:MAG: hypothetical protein IT371_26085 [Deltaproteobacteria bacterium]|nr:hypothetical protein [Deltaproteobacteria bacterium]
MTRLYSYCAVTLCAVLLVSFTVAPAHAAVPGRSGVRQAASELVTRGRNALNKFALGAMQSAERSPARLGTTAQIPWPIKTVGMGLYAWGVGSSLRHALETNNAVDILIFGAISVVGGALLLEGFGKSLSKLIGKK